MNCYRVSAQQSVVAGSISSGGDYGKHCWWDLIRSKQLKQFCSVFKLWLLFPFPVPITILLCILPVIVYQCNMFFYSLNLAIHSKSSIHADNINSFDSLVLSVTIVHCHWQVLYLISSVCIKLINFFFLVNQYLWCPCEAVHRRILHMRLNLLLEQYPAWLVHLTQIVSKMEGKWLYSCNFVGYCFLFKRNLNASLFF